MPSPALQVRFLPGPPLRAALRQPELRGVAARVGAAVLARWPRPGGLVVQVHQHRTTIFALRERGAGLVLGLHWSVLSAERDLLATLLDRDPDAWARLRAFHTAWQAAWAEAGGEPAPRAPRLKAQGRVHDLESLRDHENQAHFAGALDVPVGWGRYSPNGAPSTRLRLGSCGGQPPVIRVHPVLDHADVPDWFVRFILFHELLHVAIPPRSTPSGRRVVHGRAFRAKERAHPHYAAALAWERANIHRLLQRAGGP